MVEVVKMTASKATAFRATAELENKIQEVQEQTEKQTGLKLSRSQVITKLVNDGYEVWKKGGK
jgi:hypothetical protein